MDSDALLIGLALLGLRKLAVDAASDAIAAPAPSPATVPQQPRPVPVVQAPVPQVTPPSQQPSPFDRFTDPIRTAPIAPALAPAPAPAPAPIVPPTREETIERIFQRIANSSSPFVNDPTSQTRFERPRVPIFTTDAVQIREAFQSWGGADTGPSYVGQTAEVIDPRYQEFYLATSQGHTITVYFDPQGEGLSYGPLSNPCMGWPQGDYDPPCPYRDARFSADQFQFLYMMQKVAEKVGRLITYRRANGYWQPVGLQYLIWNTSDAWQNMALLSVALGAVGGGLLGQTTANAVNLARTTYAAYNAFDQGDILKGLASLGKAYMQVDALI